MNQFKPGDWIRHKLLRTVHKCVSINNGEFDNKISVIPSPSFDSEYMTEYILWTPKEGEWVVIADDITPDLWAVFKFNNHSRTKQILPLQFLGTLKDQHGNTH